MTLQIDPADFEKLVDRKIDFLIADAIYRAWAGSEKVKKVTGWSELAMQGGLVLTSTYMITKTDVKRIMQLTIEQGTVKFAKEFCQRGEQYGESALSFSHEIKNKKMTDKPTQELMQLLEKFDEKSLNLLVFTSPTHPIALAVESELRKILEDKINRNVEIDHLLTVLTFPTRENTPVIENKELMQIALEIQMLKTIPHNFSELPTALKVKLQQHANKFGFLGARGAGLQSWATEDLYKRATDVARSVGLEEKIEKSQHEAAENRKEVEKIENELKFSAGQRELVDAAKLLVWFRTYRTEVMYHIYADIENLLIEIANKFGYSLEEIKTMSTAEILNIPKLKVERKTLEQRNKAFAILLENSKVREVKGKELEELQKIFTATRTNISELRGTVACRGKVTGKAKIVLTSAELDKVQVGDILITNMTTPDFVPAMQRAAAFVTNEGGITCHAAIISRELNKPCVIATKMATIVFKDGDLVEVDAIAGIVRKLPQR